jgi:hypothetical protein
MDQIPDDLDKRLAEQRRLSDLRYVETMEWFDERREREKRWRRHYARFKWFYRTAIAGGRAVVILGSAAWGWIIAELILRQTHAPTQVFPPGTVVTIPPAPGAK